MNLSCALPHPPEKRILLSHGGGARHSSELLKQVIFKHFGEQTGQHDGACLARIHRNPVITTDSYVIQPLFFPGGNIGSLAICGTLNDLAVSGARPLALTVAFILEEGLEIGILEKIVMAMSHEAGRAGVQIVSGDTKVIERGRGDGLYINVTGLGELVAPSPVLPGNIREGDAILVSGDIGRHGLTIMATREGLNFETNLQSDCESIWPQIKNLYRANLEIHCLRDLTRGGLGMCLSELSESSGYGFTIESESIPINPGVSSLCEILGLDPLFAACEGRFLTFLPENQVARAVDALKMMGANPALIGYVTAKEFNSRVILKNTLDTGHFLIPPSGEQLPRIC